jgi:hypothetical protein
MPINPITVIKQGINFFLQDFRITQGILSENRTYGCANPEATEGYPPRTIEDCESRFFSDDPTALARLKPSQTEPTDGELVSAFTNLKMCSQISSQLGESYLGCFYNDPNNAFSCNCPKQGADFEKIQNVAIKQSTFWNTDPISPLYRRALLSLMNAVKIDITVAGRFDIKPGDIIQIYDPPNPEYQLNGSKLNGKWLVLGINHRIFKDRHHEMVLSLSAFGNAVGADTFADTSTSNITALESIER